MPAKIDSTTTSTAGTVDQQVVFDGMGRVVRDSTKGPSDEWIVTATAFDEMGRVAWRSEPEFAGTDEPAAPLAIHKTRYTYDALGRTLTITPPDNRTRSFSYVGARLRQRSTAVAVGSGVERSFTTAEELDAFGRLAAVTEDGVTARYTYDVADRLTGVSMGTAAQTRTFDYDGRGFLLSEQHPELGPLGNGRTHYLDYDPLGHPGRRYPVTANGHFDVTFSYDSAERLTEVKQTATNVMFKSFTYDIYGTYSFPGKLVVSARYNTTVDLGRISVFETYDYSGSGGRLSRRDITVASNLPNTFAPETFFHGQTYTTLGSIDKVLYPDRTAGPEWKEVAHTYTNGVLTGVGSYASMTYHPNGLPDTITHKNQSSSENVIEKWTLDGGMPRPAQIRAANTSDQELWTTGPYQYDGSGNIKQIGVRTYEYDGSGRLRATSEGGARTSYVYDEYGNYLGPEAPASPPCVPGFAPCRWFSYQPPHRIRETTNHYEGYGYDEAGNVVFDGVRSFSYDPLGTMTSSGTGSRQFRYVYTVDDERIALIERGSAIDRNRIWWTLRGFDKQLLTVWKDDSLNGTRSITWHEDYIRRGASLLARKTPTGTFHYVLDHLGSPRYITMGAARPSHTQSFSPFGTGGTSDGGTLQFTGQERDAALATNLADLPDNFHARQYDPGRGRFLSLDPLIDFKRAPTNPQIWNRYTYVVNNPLRFIDPSGKYTCEGNTFECAVFEAILNVARTAAAEARRVKTDGADRLTKIIQMYGAPGTDTGVHVVFGASEGRMDVIVKGAGQVTITVDRDDFYDDFQAGRFLRIAGSILHEGDHGLFGRTNPILRLTRNYDLLYQSELSAYRASGYMYQAFGINDTNNAIWQVGTGWTPNLEHFARQTALFDCERRGGCRP